jgi:hypothetical protein
MDERPIFNLSFDKAMTDDLKNAQQAAEKRPSAAFPSSFVIAAYVQVRLIPQDIGRLASGHF